MECGTDANGSLLVLLSSACPDWSGTSELMFWVAWMPNGSSLEGLDAQIAFRSACAGK